MEASESASPEDIKGNEDAVSKSSNSERKEEELGSWYLQQQQRPTLTRQFTAYSELCCCVIL